jgi:hypothetical protein
MMKSALWQGLLAGAAGVTAMTVGEKLEQRLTGRPDSHVPALVLRRLARRRDDPGRPVPANRVMHFGQGVVLGVLRSVADVLAARSGLGPGQRHAAVLPGRHPDVGPLPRAAASKD